MADETYSWIDDFHGGATTSTLKAADETHRLCSKTRDAVVDVENRLSEMKGISRHLDAQASYMTDGLFRGDASVGIELRRKESSPYGATAEIEGQKKGMREAEREIEAANAAHG